MATTIAQTAEPSIAGGPSEGPDPVVLLLEVSARLVSSDPRAALAALGQASCLLRSRSAAEGRCCELTPSQHRVVVLAASGISNQDVATRLSLSVRTIECHLSHAYAKLGIRSKAELAAWWATSALDGVH